MTELFLSNLAVAPNLLPETAEQGAFWGLTIFEIRDVLKRCDHLNPGGDNLPDHVRTEWQQLLFWGEPPFPELNPAWFLQLAPQAEAVYAEFLVRPTLEVAWELLVAADIGADVRAGDSPSGQISSELARNVRQVLAGPEFRLDQAAVDEHLARITGRTV